MQLVGNESEGLRLEFTGLVDLTDVSTEYLQEQIVLKMRFEGRDIAGNQFEDLNKTYKDGFSTDVETFSLPSGLDEGVVKYISQMKNEPEWLLDFRLKAFEPVSYTHLRAHET